MKYSKKSFILLLFLTFILPQNIILSQSYSLSFDGTNDKVSFPNTSSIVSTDFTISIWFKSDGLNNESTFDMILDMSGNEYLEFYLNGTNCAVCAVGTFVGFIKKGSNETTKNYTLNSNVRVDDNKWHNAVMVRSSSSGSVDTYIDGTLYDKSSAGAGSLRFSDIVIGMRQADGNRKFKGKVDELAFYNKALSANEIEAIYNFSKITLRGHPLTSLNSYDDLVGYWKMDNGSGTSIKDLSGNGNDGVIDGATWIEEPTSPLPITNNLSGLIELKNHNDTSSGRFALSKDYPVVLNTYKAPVESIIKQVRFYVYEKTGVGVLKMFYLNSDTIAIDSVSMNFSDLNTGESANDILVKDRLWNLEKDESFFISYEVDWDNSSSDASLKYFLDKGDSDITNTKYWPPRTHVWYAEGSKWDYLSNANNFIGSVGLSDLKVSFNEDDSTTFKLELDGLEPGDNPVYTILEADSNITVSINDDEVSIRPNRDWNGKVDLTIKAEADSRTASKKFSIIVIPVNDVPQEFEWTSIVSDSVLINKDNLNSTYDLDWTKSLDVDGDTINYIVYAKIGEYRSEEIFDTTATSYSILYEEIAEGAFEGLPGNAATVRFTVWAHDGIDSVKAGGEDRILYVNRYDYLSIESEGIPTEFALHENYPNPFNPTTQIRFDLPEMGNVTLSIYNMLGQKVKTFNMQSAPAGYHALTWNATNDLGAPISAGVYLYQLQTDGYVKTKKMILLK